jgi:cytochrome bd-type quinol oxidase subunit 2
MSVLSWLSSLLSLVGIVGGFPSVIIGIVFLVLSKNEEQQQKKKQKKRLGAILIAWPIISVILGLVLFILVQAFNTMSVATV